MFVSVMSTKINKEGIIFSAAAARIFPNLSFIIHCQYSASFFNRQHFHLKVVQDPCSPVKYHAINLSSELWTSHINRFLPLSCNPYTPPLDFLFLKSIISIDLSYPSGKSIPPLPYYFAATS